MTPTLLPCPFCGQEALTKIVDERGALEVNEFQMLCRHLPEADHA